MEPPYLEHFEITRVYSYNPDYGDDRKCKCGHTYDRHFDPYLGNQPVGCKYCECYQFEEGDNNG